MMSVKLEYSCNHDFNMPPLEVVDWWSTHLTFGSSEVHAMAYLLFSTYVSVKGYGVATSFTVNDNIAWNNDDNLSVMVMDTYIIYECFNSVKWLVRDDIHICHFHWVLICCSLLFWVLDLLGTKKDTLLLAHPKVLAPKSLCASTLVFLCFIFLRDYPKVLAPPRCLKFGSLSWFIFKVASINKRVEFISFHLLTLVAFGLFLILWFPIHRAFLFGSTLLLPHHCCHRLRLPLSRNLRYCSKMLPLKGLKLNIPTPSQLSREWTFP